MHPTLQMVRSALQQNAEYGFAIAACLLAGLAFGFLRISASADVAAQSERWNLPKDITTQFSPLTPEDIAARFWNTQPIEPKKKTDAVVKKSAPAWRFVGTFDQGAALLAIIELDTGKVQQLKNGDTLPDGAVITKVMESALSFERQGAEQTARLFVESKSE